MSTLTAIRGDDEIYELTLRQADGTPLNLVGASLWFTIKRSAEDSDAQAVTQKTIGSGITVMDAAAGRADVRIAAANMAALPSKRIVLAWDCQVKDANGVISTVDRGELVVEPDVTRATT
jgi:hypothetical protein